jgi:effector-binding domain-containing protein
LLPAVKSVVENNAASPKASVMNKTSPTAGEPRIEQRTPLHYLAIAAQPNDEGEFRAAADSAFPELFGWLGQRSIEPAGPPLIRYLSFEPTTGGGEIEIAVEVGEDAAHAADGRVRAGVVPAGRYATVVHAGAYTHETEPDLSDAHAALVSWAQRNGIELPSGSGGFLERYLIGPDSEPDHSRWRTELIYPADD